MTSLRLLLIIMCSGVFVSCNSGDKNSAEKYSVTVEKTVISEEDLNRSVESFRKSQGIKPTDGTISGTYKVETFQLHFPAKDKVLELINAGRFLRVGLSADGYQFGDTTHPWSQSSSLVVAINNRLMHIPVDDSRTVLVVVDVDPTMSLELALRSLALFDTNLGAPHMRVSSNIFGDFLELDIEPFPDPSELKRAPAKEALDWDGSDAE